MHAYSNSTEIFSQADLRRFARIMRYLCLLAGIGMISAAGRLAAQEPQPGALMLKETERIIAGKIIQRGDFYEVELAPNSRVSIAVSKVSRLAVSREELYQFKCQSISRVGASSQAQWPVGDHFQLTRWCLVNDLLPQAAAHYAQVVERNADHPRVKQLGVELQQRLLHDEAFRQYLGMPPLHPPAVTQVASSHSAGAGQVSAGDLDPAVTLPASATGDVPTGVLTASTFDSTTPIQHPQIAYHFTERVQPILISRCSQAACHGVQSHHALRLLAPYGQTNSRASAENLASVLKQIEAEPQQLSALVRYAIQPHGTQRAAAIATSETRLIQELQGWIEFVRNPVVSAVSFGQPQAGTFFPPGIPAGDEASASSSVGPYPAGLKPVTPGEAPLRSVPPATPVPDGAASGPALDPFDPAEFNRKTQGARPQVDQQP